MLAAFVSVPELFGLTVMVAVAVSLLASVPILNATIPLERLVLPRVVVAETREAPAGTALVTNTPVAADGPWFVMNRVKVTLPPTKTELVETVIARLRSASELIVVRRVEALLLGLKSASKEVTLATFVATPLASGVVTIVTRAFVPLASVPKSQNRPPSTLLQFPRVFVAEMKVTLGGSASVNTSDVAAEGPLLLIVMV